MAAALTSAVADPGDPGDPLRLNNPLAIGGDVRDIDISPHGKKRETVVGVPWR